jgi:hypothetical protein
MPRSSEGLQDLIELGRRSRRLFRDSPRKGSDFNNHYLEGKAFSRVCRGEFVVNESESLGNSEPVGRGAGGSTYSSITRAVFSILSMDPSS